MSDSKWKAEYSRLGVQLSVSLVLLASASIGCRDKITAGNYNGNLSITSAGNLSRASQQPVRIQISYAQKGSVTASVSDIAGKGTLMRPLVASNFKHQGIMHPVTFDLNIPDLQSHSIQMQQAKKDKKEAKDCYLGNTNYQVEFCFDEENFTLNVTYNNSPRISLFGSRFDIRPPIAFEPSKVFTVSEAIDVALQKNADILQERETMFQAKARVKRAYLMLLPHLSFDPALAIAKNDLMELIAVAGDIVPFLFPSNWIAARAQKWQYKAESMAEVLLKLNIASSVHTLAINYVAHRDEYYDVKALRTQTAEALNMVDFLEQQHSLAAGSRDTMQVILDKLDYDLTKVDRQLDDDSEAISHTLGFNNPDAVKDIVLGEETTPVDQIPILDKAQKLNEAKEFANIAVMNSFEIRQQDFLKKAAGLNEKGLYVNWISSGPEAPLGFNLIEDFRIAKSIMHALNLKVDSIRKNLTSHAFDMVEERNELRRYYPTAESSLNLRRNRLTRVLASLSRAKEAILRGESITNIDFRAGEIKGVIEDIVDGFNSYYVSRAIVQMNQAELDRIALKGNYTKLLPHLQRIMGDLLELNSLGTDNLSSSI